MEATREAGEARLRIEPPDGATREVRLVPGSPLRLGRSEEAEVRLDGPGVSRLHAEVVREGNAWIVRDAGSRNGIFTEEGRVDEAPLDDRRPVALAGFSLRLASGEPEPEGSEEPELTITVTRSPSGRVGALQLASLRGLSAWLRKVETAEDRLDFLVEALVANGFEAWHAGVVAREGEAVEALASSPRAPSPWRLSRTALAAAAEGNGPVLATPAGGGSVGTGGVEQSLVEAPAEASGVLVLPMGEDAERFLYVVLPAAQATPDWLALGVLVADAWAAAEAGWAAQADAVAAARLNQDLERARAVQRGLLPATLDLDPRLDVASHYRACHGIGGDHLDALPMPDGRILFLVADVCGKGVQAALVSASVRTYVRAVVPTAPTLPGLVGGLNRHLVEALRPGSFVTAVFAAVDPATGACELAHAGHPPALVVDASGSAAAAVEDIAGGMPLGIVDDAEIDPASLQLPPGGRLLLYSDGLSELQKDGRWLGTAGLADLLGAAGREAADRGSEAVAGALVRGLDALAGEGPADDDQAFVLVRRAG